jgi:peroxiredoxin
LESAFSKALAFSSSGPHPSRVSGVVKELVKNWVLPGIALILVVAAVQAFFNSQVAVADGDQAPEFSLLDTEGVSQSLSEHRGKMVVLNFWGTWCPPCIKELPGLSRFALENPDVLVLGIAVDSGTGKRLAAEKKRLAIEFPVMPADHLVQSAYGVRVLPTTFLIDGQGVVRRHQVGVITPDRLYSWLR